MTPSATPEITVNCTNVDISEQLFALDGGAANQLALIKQAAAKIRKSSLKKKQEGRVVSGKLVTSAHQLYLGTWTIVWSVPTIIQSCDASPLCITSDHSGSISTYLGNVQSLDNIYAQLLTLGRKTRAFSKSSVTRLSRREKEALKANQALAATVPLTTTVCAGSSS